MNLLLYSIISFLIAAGGSAYGAFRLFRKNTPMYFKLLICASGSFAIQQLSLIVNIWCDVSEMFSIGMIGIFACIFFLFSANFGTLDKLVDDGRNTSKARKIAFAAPLVMVILTTIAFLSWKEIDLLYAVAWIIILLPSLPASYFNLKHLLLPVDSFEFLKTTKKCNIIALLIYVITALFVICSAVFSWPVYCMLALLISIAMLLLSIFAVKGAAQWKI